MATASKFHPEQLKEKKPPTSKTKKVNKEGNQSQRQNNSINLYLTLSEPSPILLLPLAKRQVPRQSTKLFK